MYNILKGDIMNYEEVSTFLEIIRQGSISKAADALYISQGTASARIQSLEQQLGITLFYRQQGLRSILLTPQGEEFQSIAQQYISLCSEAESIRYKQQFKTLHLACTDSINRLLSKEFYPQFTKRHPEIILSIYTEHATEIYKMIETGNVDLGFGRSLHANKNVTATPLYSEETVLLCHKSSDISMYNEIHIHYSEEYQKWHIQHFPEADHPKVTIGTLSMLEPFLNEKNTWAIVQRSIAEELSKANSDLCFKTLDNPFQYTTYFYHHKHPKSWMIPVIDLFMEELGDYLNSIQIKSTYSAL